ncbi:lipid IV(A) 3-deoxy-D-manno-octulosonic acid transferase [Vibrio astriarenae]
MTALVRWAYTAILFLISPLLLWGLYRPRPNKPKFGKRWIEHFGLGSAKFTKPVIWIHAVSVGEVLASKKLIADLARSYPEKTVLVTTTTSTGAEQVKQLGEGVVHQYMPIDFSWCVRHFIKRVKPEVFVIVETELWPNTIHTVSKAKVPIVLVNGRLSEKSLNNYQKIRPLIHALLTRIDLILTVSERDRERFEKLSSCPDKIISTGNLKYDVTVPEQAKQQGAELRNFFGKNRKILVAASTHQGEDEIALNAFIQAKRNLPELLLIIVPRHPERFDDVADLIRDKQLTFSRRSGEARQQYIDVYLADTMGEMFTFLSAADLVLMGGSFVGDKVGGHNYIEPVAVSKPCLTGPSYYNFQEIAEDLIQLSALTIVTEKSLCDTIITTLSKPIDKMLVEDWANYIDSKASSMNKTKAYLTRYIK